MATTRSANTYIHTVRDGYSPRADGPKTPPKGGSAAGYWTAKPDRAKGKETTTSREPSKRS